MMAVRHLENRLSKSLCEEVRETRVKILTPGSPGKLSMSFVFLWLSLSQIARVQANP